MGWWMNFFKDLIEAGVHDTTNYIHSECMKFVFTALLQRELFVILGTVIELETQIPPMQQSIQQKGKTFILHIVITIYIHLIIKTLQFATRQY